MKKIAEEPCKQVGSQQRSSMVAAIRGARKLSVLAMLMLTAILVATALAADDGNDLDNIFRPFRDTEGRVQSLPLPGDPSLNAHNSFFDAGVGTNGQACVTCHQPDQAFTIRLDRIRDAFLSTGGQDPLFRLNDTADRPDANVSTLDARAEAYRLFLELGVVRFGRPVLSSCAAAGLTPPACFNFTIEPQNTDQFGPLPSSSDPQGSGPRISAFRRPLVNTNVNLDSAVLWDGRDKIDHLADSQVPNAIKSLLLGPGTDTNANSAIADFMTGVFTDQISLHELGSLSAHGATGGVRNLLQLAQDPARPCLFKTAFPTTPHNGIPVLTPFSPSTCTQVDDNNPHTFGADLFDAWANLSSGEDDADQDGANALRASIARGQAVFNTANLVQPPDLNGKLLDVGSTANGGVNSDHPDRIPAGQPIHCVTCHATHNLGNNPNPNFIGRIGTDSIDILSGLVATRSAQDPLVKDILDNVEKLPLYCLRPDTDPTPFSVAACGTDPTDVKTTDPSRAMVTGLIADAGKFKPPILRDLAARGVFFHAGTASDLLHLIDFYDARFQINLTQQQKNDLANFLKAF